MLIIYKKQSIVIVIIIEIEVDINQNNVSIRVITVEIVSPLHILIVNNLQFF